MYILGRYFSALWGEEGKSRDDGVMEFCSLQEGGREFSLCHSLMLRDSKVVPVAP